jgi:hypothetical protein
MDTVKYPNMCVCFLLSKICMDNYNNDIIYLMHILLHFSILIFIIKDEEKHHYSMIVENA